MTKTRTALAVAAHPDDIEFTMAGTLLLLQQAGWETHYLNLASGNCGSMEYSAQQTRKIRASEAQAAARLLKAHYHPSFLDDLEIFYDASSLQRLAAIVREVEPAILLTHSPQDYMEDHMNTCRLATTAAFARGMPNYRTLPRRPAIESEVTLYHAMPHGLRSSMGEPVIPALFVDTSSVHKTKRAALACHRSQKEWLDRSQGLDSYLHAMDEMSRAIGRMSKRFSHAEGWRKHSHLGYCAPDADPLLEALRMRVCIPKQKKKGAKPS